MKTLLHISNSRVVQKFSAVRNIKWRESEAEIVFFSYRNSALFGFSKIVVQTSARFGWKTPKLITMWILQWGIILNIWFVRKWLNPKLNNVKSQLTTVTSPSTMDIYCFETRKRGAASKSATENDNCRLRAGLLGWANLKLKGQHRCK